MEIVIENDNYDGFDELFEEAEPDPDTPEGYIIAPWQHN